MLNFDDPLAVARHIQSELMSVKTRLQRLQGDQAEDVKIAQWFKANVIPRYAPGERFAISLKSGLTDTLAVTSWQGDHWLITVKRGMAGAELFDTLAHELGHVALGHAPRRTSKSVTRAHVDEQALRLAERARGEAGIMQEQEAEAFATKLVSWYWPDCERAI